MGNDEKSLCIPFEILLIFFTFDVERIFIACVLGTAT